MYFYKLYQIKADFERSRNMICTIIKQSGKTDLSLYYKFVFQFEAYRDLNLEEFIKTVDNIRPDTYTGDDVYFGDIVVKVKEDKETYYFCSEDKFKEIYNYKL